jgi:glycosyltransferase involved in cell wall biosynthesis
MIQTSFPSCAAPPGEEREARQTGSTLAAATREVARAEGPGTRGPLRLAYLVPTYPTISQSFIRREIAAVEAHGAVVQRYALRRWSEQLVDPLDVAEQRRTRAVLEVGAWKLLGAAFTTAVTRPRAFWRAAKRAMHLARRSQRGRFIHAIYLGEACVLRRWFQDARIEHVHVHFGTNGATVALLCQLLGGPSYSFTAHGTCDIDHAWSLGLDDKVAQASFAVVVCSFLRSQLYRWIPYEHWSKVRVVRCGLDESFLNPEATPVPATRRLIYVGRLSEEKGLPILIQAAGRLKAQGQSFELVLVGDGPLRPLVETLIDRLGLAGSVRITGWQTSTQVRELICGSRALVLPSFLEGLPVVVMEALALYRPVISTNVGGIAELVVPGSNGWLVPASSVEDLAAAMRAALEAAPEQLERMGRAGAELIQRRHDARNEAGTLIELFLETTGRSAAPATPADSAESSRN